MKILKDLEFANYLSVCFSAFSIYVAILKMSYNLMKHKKIIESEPRPIESLGIFFFYEKFLPSWF